MLYGLEWLDPNTEFPPKEENNRLIAYKWYAGLFDINPFEAFGNYGNRLIANFDEYFRLPLLLGYQRLSTIKFVDMVMGEPPSITVNDSDELTDAIADVRDQTNFDEKLQQMLIDFSRYGACVVRIFNDDFVEDRDAGQFAVWSPGEWFPVFTKDGTKRIKEHVLVWRVNYGTPSEPAWFLNIQRHPVQGGHYFEERYAMDGSGSTVTVKVRSRRIDTDGMPCLVQIAANLPTTTNPYGTSDYKIINELVMKATERMRQILYILDRHSDPSMTGPATMLETDEQTQELVFKPSQFYAVSPGEEHPEYLTWDGKLDAAFKGLEVLLNQIYILSEMGEAMLGNTAAGGQAISGTAMRYKMMSPLEKARRAQNSFTLPLKKLVATLMQIETGEKLRYQDVNITWGDALPKDPRELAELTRLQTGAPQIIPLKHALMQNYDMDTVDAEHFIEEIYTDQEMWKKIATIVTEQQASSATNGDAPIDEANGETQNAGTQNTTRTNAQTRGTGDGNGRPGQKGNPAAPPNPQRKGSINTPSKTGTKNVNNRREDTE